MNDSAAKSEVDLDLEFPIDPSFDPPKPRMTLDEYGEFCRRFAGKLPMSDPKSEHERCFVEFEIK